MLTTPHRNRFGASLIAAGLLAACAPAATVPTATAPAVEHAVLARAAATITTDDMARRIGALAHDSMRGRDTPSPELESAARYLTEEFRRAGLQPAGEDGTFIQRFPYQATALVETILGRQGVLNRPSYGVDFFMIPGQAPRAQGPVFYAGRAGQVTSLPGEVRGTVLIFDLPGAALNAQWQAALTAALQVAMPLGPAAVGFVLEPGFSPQLVGQLAPMVAGQQAPIPIFGMTHRSAEAMFEGPHAGWAAVQPPARIPDAVLEIGGVPSRVEHMVPNVVGVLRGADPALRNTYVVLTAHFDHVGVGAPDERGDSIYNGADDNASGTAALIEIADAFAALPSPPGRSILFLAVSGEEKGLLGSMFFAANPTVPGDAMIANINMDMISRGAPDTLIAIGQEYSTFEPLLDEVLAAHPELGFTVIRDPYPEERLFFRSDQLSFIQRGIPAVALFSGLHEDYHRPSDRPDRSDPDKAARVAQFAFLIANRIANDPVAPTWTREGERQVQEILRSGGM
jgi:hypothetical protein